MSRATMSVRVFHRDWPVIAVLGLFVEVALIFFSVWLAYLLRFWGDDSLLTGSPLTVTEQSGIFTLAVIGSFYARNLYDSDIYIARKLLIIEIGVAMLIASLMLWGLYFIFPGLALGRGVFAIAVVLSIAMTIGWRIFLSWTCDNDVFNVNVLIVGSGETALAVAKQTLARQHLGYRVVGFVDDRSDKPNLDQIKPNFIGSTKQIYEIAREHQVSRIVVAQADSRGRLDLDGLLKCKTAGVPVQTASDFLEIMTGRIDIKALRKSSLIFSEGFMISPTTLLLKRLMDVAAGAIGLVFVMPIMLLTALAIRLDSPGPVFYRQERIGRAGKPFTMWKFRSMVQNAEAVSGEQWSEENDPRITRIGRFIRKYRIDELPQLWNVLIGNMSLIGPRPERGVFVQNLIELCPIYEQRLVVSPGITGWAQIKAPYAASVEESLEKLEYDLFYIRRLSIMLDLSILLSTLKIVLLGRGGR